MRRILLLAVASAMFPNGASATKPTVVFRVSEGVLPGTVLWLFVHPL